MQIGAITISKKGKFAQPRHREEAELEEAFEQVTAAANSNSTSVNQYVTVQQSVELDDAPLAPSQKQKKIRTIAICTVVVVLLLAIGIGTFFYLDYTKDDGLIYSNVYALGINLGGMTPEEAQAAIHEVTDETYSKKNLTIQLPDTTLVLSPSATQVSLDVEKLVEDAYNYGRSGSRWARTQAKAAAALTSYELDTADYLTLNTSFIQEVLDQHAAAIASELTQPTVTVSGEVPDLNRVYDDAAADASVVHMTMTIQLGTPYRVLDTKLLMNAILDAYDSNNFETIQAQYTVTEPDALDLQALFQEYCIAPVDAILDETTYDITPEVLGYGFDVGTLQALIDSSAPGETLEYTFCFLPAEVTEASLSANLFQDVLASADTNHVYNPDRTNNLTLAANAINGTIIRPGETFSFNEIVGERTAEKGYKPAAVYSGGATVNEVGGGICQVASTIYYCTLYADLEIVQRTAHRYTVDYVPLGMDATIYWGSLDFKFRNNTDYPIRIDASVSGGQVHVKLVGTNTKDYYIKMTYETISGPDYGETKYKVYAPGNSQGYTDGQVIQTAYAGRTVKTYRCKYDKATDTLISSSLEATSTYQKRDKIICIIGDPTAPTDSSGKPIETTTEATTQPATEAPTETTTSDGADS